MKKVLVILIMLVCVVSAVFINIYYNKSNDTDKEKETKSDELEFVGIGWTRSGEADTEFLGFAEDGTYYYYCACGNPVNDSDVCETYTYDSEQKIISLNCMEEYSGTVTTIKVISYEEDKLVLDFDGDIKEFERDFDE